MDLLEKSHRDNVIIELLLSNMNLFHAFDQIYLFGSALTTGNKPNDIDLLLVYKEYNEDLVKDMLFACSYFEEKNQITIDLTALSVNEMLETAFIEKISKYKRLK